MHIHTRLYFGQSYNQYMKKRTDYRTYRAAKPHGFYVKEVHFSPSFSVRKIHTAPKISAAFMPLHPLIRIYNQNLQALVCRINNTAVAASCRCCVTLSVFAKGRSKSQNDFLIYPVTGNMQYTAFTARALHRSRAGGNFRPPRAVIPIFYLLLRKAVGCQGENF